MVLLSGGGELGGGHELIDQGTMEHFSKGHSLKKQSGVDDDRRGEEERNS